MSWVIYEPLGVLEQPPNLRIFSQYFTCVALMHKGNLLKGQSGCGSISMDWSPL